MFIGRKNELKDFNDLYKKNKFQMAVIYGRRRVGKTYFINEFCKNKKHIFFSCDQSTHQENLNKYSSLVFEYFKDDRNEPFESFDNALLYIVNKYKNKKKPLVLVFDEFPYLVSSNKSILSKLQNLIDTKLKSTNIFIILCGSYMSFMEDKILSKKSPIYGRRTAQIKMNPFNYIESIEFVKNAKDEDKLLYYGIFGGTPLYLNYVDDKKSLKENVISLLLKKTGYLYEETNLLLKQELQNPNIYYSIIEAIANGYTKLNEIVTKIGENNAKVIKYLNVLIKLDIIDKKTPFYEKSTSRKSIYLIKDNMFRFWFRYVMENKTLLESDNAKIVYEKKVLPTLNNFMGLCFEKICEEYLLHINSRGKTPFLFTDIGKWWGTNKISKKQDDIDIVASDKKNYIFSECKYTNEKVDIDTYEKLLEKSKNFQIKGRSFYYIFSKSGFTDKMKKEVKNKNLYLIDIKNILLSEVSL